MLETYFVLITLVFVGKFIYWTGYAIIKSDEMFLLLGIFSLAVAILNASLFMQSYQERRAEQSMVIVYVKHDDIITLDKQQMSFEFNTQLSGEYWTGEIYELAIDGAYVRMTQQQFSLWLSMMLQRE